MTATGRVETRREKEDSSTPSTGVPGPGRGGPSLAGCRGAGPSARLIDRQSLSYEQHQQSHAANTNRPTTTHGSRCAQYRRRKYRRIANNSTLYATVFTICYSEARKDLA